MARSRIYNYLGLLFYLVLLTTIGCTVFGEGAFTDRVGGLLKRWFGEPTPREVWLQQAKYDGVIPEATLDLWEAEFASAKVAHLSIPSPHREVLYHGGATRRGSGLGFSWRLPPGRLLTIEAYEASQPLLFGELFAAGDLDNPVATWDTVRKQLQYESFSRNGEDVVLVVQPPPNRPTRYELRVMTEPSLVFPVAGKDESNIQSFWGASRDGGRRRHEGNDIFAPKGTPLLAVADGRVSRTGNGGLGGKTVWLSDGEGRSISYYYAHLDEQLVRGGDYVERGDTIGLVGNTGNARTTPPHLHFGTYAGGAFDPLPLLRRADELPGRAQLSLPPDGGLLNVPARGNHYLRELPERGGEVIRQLENGEPVTVTGVSGRFYRVTTGSGEAGYANFD